MKSPLHLTAWATSALFGTGFGHAADTSTQMAQSTPLASLPMSAAAGKYNSIVVGRSEERERFAAELRAGLGRAGLDKILTSNGYQISAINEDNRDYLENEVVRGKNSYEVKVGFGNGAISRPTQIEVERDLWRAETTQKMVDDANFRPPGAIAADPNSRYNNKRYLMNWTDEKDRLEKAMPGNLKVGEYRGSLEALGCRVTLFNERGPDYMEFEIVKGNNSYELQINVDPNSRTARTIDVTSNFWEADTTDAATDWAERNFK